jgi:polyisoprenyl-phosphate glycosyltransferase
LPELGRRLHTLLEQLDGAGEVIFVDDGSSDGSFEIIVDLCASDRRFKCVRLSRNFGHQIAITAGLDVASGEAVVVMDADLQDPPDVVLELARHWRAGHDVVYAIRDARVGESRFKEMTAMTFYRLFRRLADLDVPVDAGDFRLVDRRALDAFLSMRENNRYVRGMFSWIGFDQIGVRYQRHERYAGETKYPLRRMIRFATDAVVSFSDAPLRLALGLGFVVSFLSFLFGIAALVVRLIGLYSVPGLASIAVVIAFVGGVQLVILGMIGSYIARVYDEVKHRPLYIVRESRGFEVSHSGAIDQGAVQR